MKISTSMLLLSLACSGAHAGFINGNQLQQWSKGSGDVGADLVNASLFSGYVSGVVDTGDDVLFCTGNGVTLGQCVMVVAKYLENNPEKWNLAAPALVIGAMQQAFPCGK